MRTLYLLRHGLTEANEKRLYCGRTDLPLTPNGQALARDIAARRPLPPCELYVSSGMARANETLAILTGQRPVRIIPELSEMDFGRFEMLGYETLRYNADYQRWIGDVDGSVPCTGGESTGAFRRRVLSGGTALLKLRWSSAIVVCHGGVIVNLMSAWFPSENRSFYEWQPAACEGWRIEFDDCIPRRFESV